MSLIRNISAGIFVFLFSIFIAVFLISYQMSYLTNHDVLASHIVKIISPKLNLTQLTEFQPYLVQFCESGNITEFPVKDLNITITCDEIKKKNLTSLIVIKMFDKNIYYRNYSCVPPSCWIPEDKKDYTVYISSQGHEFFEKLKQVSIILIILSAIFVFVLSDPRIKAFRSLGVSLLFVSIPFLFSNSLISSIQNKIPREAMSVVSDIIHGMQNISYLFLLIGIIFIFIYLAWWVWSKKKK